MDTFCCCFNDDDDDDAGLNSMYGLDVEGLRDHPKEIELRLWPNYNAKSEIVETDAERQPIYLCRYLVPWCLARGLTKLGLGCGLRLSTGGLPGWMLGTRPGRRCVMFLILVGLLCLTSYAAYMRGRHLHIIFASPCYVCNPKYHQNTNSTSLTKLHGPTSKALRRYAAYTHGVGCALDDAWVQALDTPPENMTTTTKNPWQRYDQFQHVHDALPATSKQKEDWRNALPSVFLIGCRGAGTTSLVHYLDAHADIAIRRGALTTHLGRNQGKAVTWDNHFFASLPDWTADELRAWMQRGWGVPTIRDHQGLGRTRIEVGPDYLGLTASGAAASIRRANPHAKFVVLLRDPFQLIQQAHARAVEAGVESRSFEAAVAHELPRLARCLWWDEAGLEEQRQRLISGMCGGSEPGRIGPPYLWRGLVSEYLSHWILSTTNQRHRWYFIKSQDLLQQPNRTLNQLVVKFLGLPARDYTASLRYVWHPDPSITQALMPKASWTGSWKAHVPRAEFIQIARKRTSDALLKAAESLLKKTVPGLQSALETTEKLRRLHCKLAGFLDPDTLGAHRCLDDGDETTKGTEAEEEESDKTDKADEEVVLALRDFLAIYQTRLMNLIEAMQHPGSGPRKSHKQTGDEEEENDLQHFFLGEDNAES